MFDIFSFSDNILDVCGLYCPEPLMMVRNTVRSMLDGQILLIITDDLVSIKDFTIFCHFMNHTFLAQEIEHLPYRFLLKKGIK